MKILPLDSTLEPLFWNLVYTDIADYYFFITDMKNEKEQTQITLALDEENQIDGIMIIYRNYIVQLRGSKETAKTLLARLDIEKAEIQTPIEYDPLEIPNKYEKKKALELSLMTLRKGEETPQVKHSITKLSEGDAENIAALMRQADPDWWGETKAEQIAERMSQRLWLGMKIDGKLVSIGGARLDDWGGIITTIATHEDHRNRGYATSIVSALVKEMLKKSNIALIYVESKNSPAVRAYTKAGFQQYKKYVVVRAEKRRNAKQEIEP